MSRSAQIAVTRFDRFVGALSPKAAVGRVQARAQLNALTNYSVTRKGAENKGTLSNWFTNRLSRFTESLQRTKLVDRASDLAANDPHAASVVNSMAVNIAGPGLTPQSTPNQRLLGWTDDETDAFQASAEWAYSIWNNRKEADYCRRFTFDGIQYLSMLTMLKSGEFFRLPVWDDTDPTRTFKTALQCIDPLRCFTPSDKMTDATIRDGIVMKNGRSMGYWFANTDGMYGQRTLASNQMREVPAIVGTRPGVLHSFIPTDEEQVRGVSILAPAMKFFRDLSDCLDFELVGQIIVSSFPLFIELQNPAGFTDGMPQELDSAGNPVAPRRYQEVAPGQIMYGNALEKPHVLESKRPSDSFGIFVERILRACGASVGMPYEVITKDFSKTNYSSARAALLEAWRVFSFYQKWLVGDLCQPSWDMVLEEAFYAGMLALPKGAPDFYAAKAAYTSARWIPPRKGHVDPVKEIDALVTAIDNNLMTFADAVAELGGDWERVLRQRIRERKLIDTAGLTPVKPAGQKTIKDYPSDDKQTPTGV